MGVKTRLLVPRGGVESGKMYSCEGKQSDVGMGFLDNRRQLWT